ncbi:reverse transcriptase [Phytophthora megakarya]|uniref:Reverse transcriptase n=1 Tax=Phytophthora megakarya TaxID=4795 RepID=A0A225W9T9_9STRA|nr:reverse transcriptase [Phytophthora megakarya]
MSNHFVLSEGNVFYYVGTRHLRGAQQEEDAMLRLLVLSTMVQEALLNCNDSLEGGHQVKLGLYWIGLYADVARHVRSCPDCSSSKSRPKIRGSSPGNILAKLPFQVVKIDFVIPLPKPRRGNTALLLFQCAFTEFVIGKAMADTTALRECVYRIFGAYSLIRHDRDPRVINAVFQSFTEMIQSRSRATVSYRPQVNSQQERSVKTVMQSVRVYGEDLIQQYWDEIAEKLIFVTRCGRTLFVLVYSLRARSEVPTGLPNLEQTQVE